MQTSLEFRSPVVSIPVGKNRAALLESLLKLTIDGAGGSELRAYLEEDLDRFLYTLALIPEGASGRLLEIGANPYFMTILARENRPDLTFDYVNYFGGHGPEVRQTVSWESRGGVMKSEEFVSYNVNLEDQGLPLEDASFDYVLFCEVLEHFTMDPLKCVVELHRLLKDDGCLILTTPNVARFANVAALLDGRNLYDPFSGYGPHGRHNREYTRHELHQLMTHAGFRCDFDFTSDVHANAPSATPADRIMTLLKLTQHREHDLGQYLFTRWKKSGPANPLFPRWLYRSHPESAFS